MCILNHAQKLVFPMPTQSTTPPGRRRPGHRISPYMRCKGVSLAAGARLRWPCRCRRTWRIRRLVLRPCEGVFCQRRRSRRLNHRNQCRRTLRKPAGIQDRRAPLEACTRDAHCPGGRILDEVPGLPRELDLHPPKHRVELGMHQILVGCRLDTECQNPVELLKRLCECSPDAHGTERRSCKVSSTLNALSSLIPSATHRLVVRTLPRQAL